MKMSMAERVCIEPNQVSYNCIDIFELDTECTKNYRIIHTYQYC